MAREQPAAYYLETDPHVIAFAKNPNLGFVIPYLHQGQRREYLPDFLVRLECEGREVGTLILEVKGYDPLTHLKVAAVHRWVAAVNAEGSRGRWAYRLVTAPAMVPSALASAVRELARGDTVDWRSALDVFVRDVRAAYGARLREVRLYGSRARGDADDQSDIDVLVVLDALEDAKVERERLGKIATRVALAYDHLISAVPITTAELATSDRSVIVNARREGKVVG